MCLCAAVLSPEHALYSVQRATRGVCEGISLNDDGGGSDGAWACERAQTYTHVSVLLLSHQNLVSRKVNFSEDNNKNGMSTTLTGVVLFS